jgi:hypothetical protein
MANLVCLRRMLEKTMIEVQSMHFVSPLPSPPLSKGRESNPELDLLPSPYQGEGLGVR